MWGWRGDRVSVEQKLNTPADAANCRRIHVLDHSINAKRELSATLPAYGLRG